MYIFASTASFDIKLIGMYYEPNILIDVKRLSAELNEATFIHEKTRKD